jgi:hypothetical protein
METPTIPAVLDPAKYALTLTPGTYTDLVAATLGDAASPRDGTEAKLILLAMHTDAIGATLAETGAIVTQLGPAAAPFSQDQVSDLAGQIQPVADAADVSLATFIGLATPPTPSGGGTTGGTVPTTAVLGQPTQIQSGDFAGYSVDAVAYATVTRLHAPAEPWDFFANNYGPQTGAWDSAAILAGSPAIFSAALVAQGGEAPGTYIRLTVPVSPTQAGHYWAVVQAHQAGDPGSGSLFGVVVDILS